MSLQITRTTSVSTSPIGTNNTIGTYWRTVNSTATATSLINYPTGSSGVQTWSGVYDSSDCQAIIAGNLKIAPGQDIAIDLPDGAVLQIKANGSYEIIDDLAKVIYKANRVREFNRYINSSDLLEEFIKFVSNIGPISKQEFFDLPVELFIKWLVIRAAEADGEDADYAPVVAALPLSMPQLLLSQYKPHTVRCMQCGRFTKDRALKFCTQEHMLGYAAKHNVFT